PESAYMASVYRTPVGYLIAGGTSTATPTASGAVALLISAARQAGVHYDACTLKQAIEMSARYVPNIPTYKQGNGVINVAGAWELLKAMDRSKVHVIITSRAPVKHVYSELLATPNEGVGLYERDGWAVGDHGTRTVTFTRTSGPAAPMTFTLGFTGDTGTFSAPRSVTLPLGDPVPVTVGVAPATPGVHSAILTLDNPQVPGHAYRMLAAVVAAVPLDASNHYSVTTDAEVPRPGMRSYFYRVPPGASALEVVVDSAKRDAEVTMVEPDTRTAHVAHLVAERGRGEGGGGGGESALLPKETYVTTNPVPGVWEIRLTDVADTRTFDWRASEEGGPVPPTTARITISALSVTASAVAAADNGASLDGGGTAAVPLAAENVSLVSHMANFTGQAMSYPVGSARREHSTIANLEQKVYELDVPPGSTSLMARVSGATDPKADLDLYVYDCTGKECHIAATGADWLGDETVIVDHPAAGKWKVVVDGASVPSGTAGFDYVDAVFNQTYGMVGVTDEPAKRDGSVVWSTSVNVWSAALPTGREPFTALLVQGEASRTQPFTIGLLELPGVGRQNGSH
ncbi:MAG: S8 family serine peptidase, partial [Gemmatimonadaceae bacterium]